MLLLGTGDGVYRAAGPESTGSFERVLDCGRVVELSGVPTGVYAATRAGLYHTADNGETWTDLQLPTSDVWAVNVSGERLYAGCYPATLFVSPSGDRWRELGGLRAVPEFERWYCPEDDARARVRTIRAVPGRPGRLLVGIEVGGLYVSDDGGETWTGSRGSLCEDVHHVTVKGPAEYLVCCGRLDLDGGYGPGGLFSTTDGGDSWSRLDLGDHAYVRETLVHDGVLYVSGAQVTPGEWRRPGGARAALFESPDGGSTFESFAYPGGPREIVLSWAVDGGCVYGGTGARANDAGRLIRREAGAWVDAGRLPASVCSLAAT